MAGHWTMRGQDTYLGAHIQQTAGYRFILWIGYLNAILEANRQVACHEEPTMIILRFEHIAEHTRGDQGNVPLV